MWLHANTVPLHPQSAELLNKRFAYIPRGILTRFSLEIWMNSRLEAHFHTIIDVQTETEHGHYSWSTTHRISKHVNLYKTAPKNLLNYWITNNAKMLMGYCDKIVMNVHASRGYENGLFIQEQSVTSCCWHDLTLSLLRLVLLPGYYFLWQHLSQRGEQL